jgi:hypothetical protein
MDFRKAIANQHTPFVQRSQQSILSEKSAKAFEQCMQHFNLFHILNYAMYEEYLKVSDMIDDMGWRRHQIKKHMAACEEIYSAYTDFYHTHQSTETWYLMQDYGRLFYEKLEPKIMFLYVAVDNLLLKLGFKNHQLESRSICVEYMLIIIEDTWREFFRTYKELSGLDFSSEFKQADMAEFARHYKEIHDNINKPNYKIIASLPNQSLYVINEPSCKAAMTAIRNFINEEDNMDKAAYQAIQYSDKIKEQYEADMAKMKEEKQKEELGDVAELLSQKYKVTRL